MQRVIPILRKVSGLSFRKNRDFKYINFSNNPSRLTFYTPYTVTTQTMAYGTTERGRLNGLDYRMFITKDGQVVSPFHDIPLYSNPEAMICNMVVEIPRWTNHKMEINKEEPMNKIKQDVKKGKINKEEPMNPIKQDVKKEKVRFVKNCFPHHGYIWNYGALPQTWEDCEHVDEETGGTKGDNDPLDVCEIGQKVQKRGSVIQVKVLGVICLIDEGETDWKIICIDVNDPLANSLNDINDVRTAMPGFLEATREWFKVYKVPDGKPFNVFAFDGEYKDREFALDVIKKTNEQWKRLVGSDDNVARTGISCQNILVAGSPHKVSPDTVKQNLEQCAEVGPPEELPDDVDKWHYIPSSL